MASRWHHRFWHYLLLVTVGASLFLWNLGGATLWDLDEGRNATCSHEMRESGNWIVPTFNGSLRVDKPVLLYWCQIAAYSIFGVNEFAARLPSALAALATMLLAYELARSFFGKATGLLAGLIAASTPMLCGAARFANPDSLLHLFTVLSLFIFWLGHRNPGALWWMGLGAATGLGMLAKGPVGLVLPATAAFLFLLWDGRLQAICERRIGWAVLTWCLVALPWYVWVGVDTKGEFLRRFFLDHNAGRFGGAMEGHSGTPLYYPIVLLIGLAPWSLAAGAGIWCAIWSATKSLTPAADRRQVGHPEVAPLPASAYRFLLSWIATYVFFFTLAATKLPNYVLPVLVPCAVLAARFLDRWRTGDLAVSAWAWRFGLAAMFLTGMGLTAGLASVGGAIDLSWLRGRTIPALAPWAWIGVVPMAGTLACWHFWRRDQRQRLLASLTLTAVGMLAPLAAWGSAAFNAVKPTGTLVELARARQREIDLYVAVWQAEHLPSLNFYLQRDVTPLQSEKELHGLLRYPTPVYVFLPATAWETCRPTTRELGRELGRQFDMYKRREMVVIANQHVPPGTQLAARRP